MRFKDFRDTIQQIKIELNDEDLSFVRARYLEDADYTLDYKKMEVDMGVIDPNYNKFQEAENAAVRTPESIIESLVPKIMVQFSSLRDLCETIDKGGRSTLRRDDISTYFKLLDRDLT